MISLKNITLRRAAKVLLDSASVALQPGEKVGLVGRNGAGKSSLFALLSGELHEDSGDFSIPAHWRMTQVLQSMPETEESATDFVLSGDLRLSELNGLLSKAEHDGDGEQIGELHAQLADAGAHDARSRAQALILGLGFRSDELDKAVNSFSGGWRMRLQLARALMCPAELMLLDEPTNHLDLDALVWLESWLKRYEGTLIIISHDREFLDAVTRVTLHITEGQITRYGGNYSFFEEQRAERILQQQAAFSKQQDRIAHLQKFIDRFKAKATKAKQAQSRVKALERMERIAPVLTSADFSFEFREPPNIPNPMLAIKEASFGYGEKVILQNVSRSVLAGQRIGILGANGQGKSTLVKTIAREMQALDGKLTEGKDLRIGYFAQQELDVLHAGSSPLEHMIRLAKEVSPNAREQELRNFLGSFQFKGDMVSQAVGTMSGGEKARLVLAMIVWQQPNLLLLDEPTNHLDLTTREALQMALNEFEGTVMLVSHDRAMLRSVCDEFWLVAKGGVAPFDGDLDDYQRYLLDEAKARRESLKEETNTTKTIAISADSMRADSHFSSKNEASGTFKSKEQKQLEARERQRLAEVAKPLKKELAGLDAQMAALAREREALHEQLAQNLSPDDIVKASKRLAEVNETLESAELRWLELSEQIEALA
jgi:ATP-binding cassette, subfamily F, member 3